MRCEYNVFQNTFLEKRVDLGCQHKIWPQFAL